jgi:hypothetical protein
MNFPKFEGENPKLWKSRSERYFEMYDVDPSLWVMVALMHFEGPAARWLQSVEHRVCVATWIELCSWIHDRFARDQHELLIRQMYKIKQQGSVQDYIDRFCELVDQLQAYSPNVDQLYYTAHFIDGLRDDIKYFISIQLPKKCGTCWNQRLLTLHLISNQMFSLSRLSWLYLRQQSQGKKVQEL